MVLSAVLLAIMSGSVALGPTLYLMAEGSRLMVARTAFQKRLIVAVAAGVISMSAWGFAAWLGYTPPIEGRTAIAEAVWQYGVLTGYAGFTSATLIHGQKLRKKRPRRPRKPATR